MRCLEDNFLLWSFCNKICFENRYKILVSSFSAGRRKVWIKCWKVTDTFPHRKSEKRFKKDFIIIISVSQWEFHQSASKVQTSPVTVAGLIELMIAGFIDQTDLRIHSWGYMIRAGSEDPRLEMIPLWAEWGSLEELKMFSWDGCEPSQLKLIVSSHSSDDSPES